MLEGARDSSAGEYPTEPSMVPAESGSNQTAETQVKESALFLSLQHHLIRTELSRDTLNKIGNLQIVIRNFFLTLVNYLFLRREKMNTGFWYM